MRSPDRLLCLTLSLLLAMGTLPMAAVPVPATLARHGISGEDTGPWAPATVALSPAAGAATPLGDTVLTGYAATYTATRNMIAVERDILFPVASLPRDEYFLPESHDCQYFVAWLESDETKWEPHSHLLGDAHAMMWLKATEQGIIGPEPGSILREGQEYGFVAAHGSLASSSPDYLPAAETTGRPFLELAGPISMETRGVSNLGASDLAGVVLSGFMGFSGGDHDTARNGTVSIMQTFDLPEIATRSGDNYAYAYAWTRPQNTEVRVNIVMDLPSSSGRVYVNVTDGYFKQAREIITPDGYVHRYWGTVFSLYLYFYPPHQGREADQGLTPRSRLLWSFDRDSTAELVAGGAAWREQWSGLTGGLALELSGEKVVRVYCGDGCADNARDGDDEGTGKGEHLTGAGVLGYTLETDYLGQGLVALTDITPFNSDGPLVNAWGFSCLQIDGEDIRLSSQYLADHFTHTGVWTFGLSIGWIWISPALQNNGDPVVDSDSWWWFHSPGGATAGLVFRVRGEVLVLARIMIRPHQGYADIVIRAGAYTLDGEERDMKLWQHLHPAVSGNVVYTGIPQGEEFGPLPTGTGGISEHVEVADAEGRRVRWTPSDTGAVFCVVNHGELVAHPSEEVDGEAITGADIRFYTEHRNFGGEFYRAYAVYADTQFRVTWGGDAPVYDISLDLSGSPRRVAPHGTLGISPAVTNRGETSISLYLWVTVSGNPAIWEVITLAPGETRTVPLELDLKRLAADNLTTTHPWYDLTLRGSHGVTVEAFPLGAADADPSDNVVAFTLHVGEDGDGDDGLFGSSSRTRWVLLPFLVLALAAVFLLMKRR